MNAHLEGLEKERDFYFAKVSIPASAPVHPSDDPLVPLFVSLGAHATPLAARYRDSRPAAARDATSRREGRPAPAGDPEDPVLNGGKVSPPCRSPCDVRSSAHRFVALSRYAGGLRGSRGHGRRGGDVLITLMCIHTAPEEREKHTPTTIIPAYSHLVPSFPPCVRARARSQAPPYRWRPGPGGFAIRKRISDVSSYHVPFPFYPLWSLAVAASSSLVAALTNAILRLPSNLDLYICFHRRRRGVGLPFQAE